MRQLVLNVVAASILCCLVLSGIAEAQADAAKTFQAKCVLCHAADGSGSSPTGKALHAKDLRADEVQALSDAVLTDTITKGKGKMPAFGAKIQPPDIQKLVAYVRSLAAQK
jgi:mono/diheme cytochrome c family protein